MLFALKSKRSGGVRVTAAVHRILARGNAARDRQDWAEAAAAYRQALKSDPDLAHIWVQLGHAAKEQGLAAEAESAYRHAARLRPGDADPDLHLGHLFSSAGDHAGAGQHYLRAFQADPRFVDAATALHRAIARARGRKREQLIEILRTALADDVIEDAGPEAVLRSGPDRADQDGRISLTFDASDLIGYFAHGRLPTGIQRVQIQVITHALLRRTTRVHVCCFIDGRDDWLEIQPEAFCSLVDLSLKSGDRNDPEWISALHKLHLQLALAHPFTFPYGSYLVNLGSSWQLYNYFLFVREAKAKHAIRYVPFVHDLIPIVAPEHFTKSARREVVPWIVGVFAHADHVLVNSEATRRDLLQTGATLGRRLDLADVAVIRLDADFRTSRAELLPDAALAKWQLDREPFVLLVSTVESRKGHAVALDAWLELITSHGPGNVPKLVCVGKKGWLSGAVYRRLEQNEVLATRVAMLPAVSDDELSLLYRTCLFTIYPSFYEGWGLPITESLCYGKPVIASDTSSLPEAGGDLAVYVEPGSARALAGAVERMVFDAEHREGIAARIRAEFRPHSWSDLAEQIEAELVRMAASDKGPAMLPVPTAKLGAYHSVARGTALRVWPGAGVGEMFRVGTGWGSPDFNGCWTRPRGGELAIGLPPRRAVLRVGLLLIGAPGCDVDWRVQVRLGPSLSGSLDRAGRKWVTFTYPAGDDGGILRLRLHAEPGETDVEWEQEDEALVGLAGFFLYEQDDVAAGMRLLEAIALGNLDEVDAYRENAPVQEGVDEWGI